MLSVCLARRRSLCDSFSKIHSFAKWRDWSSGWLRRWLCHCCVIGLVFWGSNVRPIRGNYRAAALHQLNGGYCRLGSQWRWDQYRETNAFVLAFSFEMSFEPDNPDPSPLRLKKFGRCVKSEGKRNAARSQTNRWFKMSPGKTDTASLSCWEAANSTAALHTMMLWLTFIRSSF